ncbi:MAG: efflux RND transporter periplasmic adaptor subunit [Proteobacteria bacterium]|nr:efflux RND transporter periplasmic adaptor subunit [Pseudomonadota bacterium]
MDELLTMRGKIIAFFVLCIGVILGIAFLIDHNSSPAIVRPPLPQKQCVFASGRIEGKTENTYLCVLISGQIKSIPVRENQLVKKGDVLLEIDARQYFFEKELAIVQELANKGLLQAKEAQLKLAKLNLERGIILNKKKVLSEEGMDILKCSYDSLRAEIDVAKSQIEISKSQIQLAQIKLDHTKIEAPIDGKILKIDARIGEIATSQMPLIIMADISELRVRAYVDELDASLIKVGQSAKITFDNFQPIKAIVTQAAPFLGRKVLFSDMPSEKTDTKTREFWLSLKNCNLLPGQRVDVMVDL